MKSQADELVKVEFVFFLIVSFKDSFLYRNFLVVRRENSVLESL